LNKTIFDEFLEDRIAKLIDLTEVGKRHVKARQARGRKQERMRLLRLWIGRWR